MQTACCCDNVDGDGDDVLLQTDTVMLLNPIYSLSYFLFLFPSSASVLTVPGGECFLLKIAGSSPSQTNLNFIWMSHHLPVFAQVVSETCHEQNSVWLGSTALSWAQETSDVAFVSRLVAGMKT